MKKKIMIGIMIVCVFLVGYVLGTYQKNETNQYISVPQRQLNMTPEFVDFSQLQYGEKENNLQATLKLNDVGTTYNSTNLFKESYHVVVYLINNETNEEYLVSHPIKWNISKTLSLNIPIDSFLTTDESLLSDYQIEMRKLESNKEHHIAYRIEICPPDDTTPIITTVGMLK